MRGPRGIGDLRTGAEALVDPALGLQLRDGIQVHGSAVGLADHLAVPVQADGGKIAQLNCLGAGAGTVQVLYPEDEPAAAAAGEQPGQQRRPQIADVQFAGRTGSEPAGTGGRGRKRKHAFQPTNSGVHQRTRG